MVKYPARLLRLVRDGTLLREVALVLLMGAFILLLVEVRFEHKVVLGEKWQAWIPIVYFAIMVFAIPICTIFLRRKLVANILAFLFALGVVIGPLGAYFHTKGHPLKHVMKMIKADLTEPGRLAPDEEETPPPLAPLAIAGLGLLGTLVALFQPASIKSASNNTQVET